MAKNLEISFLLDFYGSMLTEKQRIMIEYYYNDDLSLAEIADNEGITRQGGRTAFGIGRTPWFGKTISASANGVRKDSACSCGNSEL